VNISQCFNKGKVPGDLNAVAVVSVVAVLVILYLVLIPFCCRKVGRYFGGCCKGKAQRPERSRYYQPAPSLLCLAFG
jgi:hypothetical protein